MITFEQFKSLSPGRHAIMDGKGNVWSILRRAVSCPSMHRLWVQLPGHEPVLIRCVEIEGIVGKKLRPIADMNHDNAKIIRLDEISKCGIQLSA